ncbi:glycosyltransferase family 39 protein [candidate division KSB1 bacterium]|nr:glycosyltransferase family 39 protein [candidate division KSB1 bacterium]
MKDKIYLILIITFLLILLAICINLIKYTQKYTAVFSDSTHYISHSAKMSICLRDWDFINFAKLVGLFKKSPIYVMYLSFFFRIFGVSILNARIASFILLPLLLVLFYFSTQFYLKEKLFSLLGVYILLGSKVILNYSIRPMPFMLSLVIGMVAVITFQVFLKKRNIKYGVIFGVLLALLFLTRLQVFVFIFSGTLFTFFIMWKKKKIVFKEIFYIIFPIIVTSVIWGIIGFFGYIYHYGVDYMDIVGSRWTLDNLFYYPMSIYKEFISFKLLIIALVPLFIFSLVKELKSEFVIFLSSGLLFGTLLLTYHTLNTPFVYAFYFIVIVFIAIIGLQKLSVYNSKIIKYFFIIVIAATILNPIFALNKIKVASPKGLDKPLENCYVFFKNHEQDNVYFMGSSGWFYYNNLNLYNIINNIKKKYPEIKELNRIFPFRFFPKRIKTEANYLIRIVYYQNSTALATGYGEHIGSFLPIQLQNVDKEIGVFNFIRNSITEIDRIDYPDAELTIYFYKT